MLYSVNEGRRWRARINAERNHRDLHTYVFRCKTVSKMTATGQEQVNSSEVKTQNAACIREQKLLPRIILNIFVQMEPFPPEPGAQVAEDSAAAAAAV